MDYDLIIVGGGPAGLCAGIYAVRRKLKTLILEKGLVGGQLALAPEIGNYPGFSKISGMELAAKMEEHAKSLGATFESSEVLLIRDEGGVKKVATPDATYSAKAVIIATGAVHRKLNAPGEEAFLGRGVSYCATCDGPLFAGKTVAVIGGGNHACEDAAYLADIAKKVYLVHRRDAFRAEECRINHVREKGVAFILNTVVEEFSGNSVLAKIKLKNTKDATTSTVTVDGVFVSIGVVPLHALAGDLGLDIDGNGYIKVDGNQMTNVTGVYAAGDVTGGVLQVAKAVGEGCIAALAAYEYIKQPYWSRDRKHE